MTTHAQRKSRRAFLRGGLAAGVGAAATLGPSRMAAAQNTSDQQQVEFDVACLVDRMRIVFTADTSSPGAHPMYGAPFLVEGLIYPSGTIPDGEDNWDPFSADAIGTWTCHGHMFNRDDRPAPGQLTVQSYFLGPIGGDVVSPPDQLSSQGFEGGAADGWSTERLVLGGSGAYAGARGTVHQRHLGYNLTSYGPPMGMVMSGLNFRFAFDIEAMPAPTSSQSAPASSAGTQPAPVVSAEQEQLPVTGGGAAGLGAGLAGLMRTLQRTR